MEEATAVNIVPLHSQAAPNKPVTLYQGPVTLRDGPDKLQTVGKLVLRWFPIPGLRFSCQFGCRHGDPWYWYEKKNIKAEIKNGVVNVPFFSFCGTDDAALDTISGHVSSFNTGKDVQLAWIGFQVVNFLAPKLVDGWTVDLEYDIWKMRITTVAESKRLFENMGETGGYAFTHVGRLEHRDGELFKAQDADDVLHALTKYLSYARGAACNLPVRWGPGAGAAMWQFWGSPIVDPWSGIRKSWFDVFHSNPLKDLFPAFAKTLFDPELAPQFTLALHWYRACSTRAGGMEGAIILGLAALEVLGSILVVNQKKLMNYANYDKLSAACKLTVLLHAIGVQAKIPEQQANLVNFASKQKWKDATAALTGIRHGYVHAKKSRRDVVLSASNLATFEAWQLSLWFQELAILHLLNHHGEYVNRIAAEWFHQVEKVPWAKGVTT